MKSEKSDNSLDNNVGNRKDNGQDDDYDEEEEFYDTSQPLGRFDYNKMKQIENQPQTDYDDQ